MGATIVDALDTLLVMDMKEEYEEGKKWIAENLNFDQVGRASGLFGSAIRASFFATPPTPKNQGVSVFEICIRFVGGLLSAYAMTGDEVLKDKAFDIAKRLLPAYNTPTGIPLAVVNLQSGTAHNWGWASGGASILSELGSMQLEFNYLSLVTGDQRFAEKVCDLWAC